MEQCEHHAWWNPLGTACQKHSEQHKNTAVQQLKKKITNQQFIWGETTQEPRQYQERLSILAEYMEEEASDPQSERDRQKSTKQVWEKLEGKGGLCLD